MSFTLNNATIQRWWKNMGIIAKYSIKKVVDYLRSERRAAVRSVHTAPDSAAQRTRSKLNDFRYVDYTLPVHTDKYIFREARFVRYRISLIGLELILVKGVPITFYESGDVQVNSGISSEYRSPHK